MAGQTYTSPSIPTSDIALNGGLNSTSGPLTLKNNESSSLQNVDFSKFGSVLKRNGYTALNTSALSGTPQGDGLHWYEFVSSGTVTRKLIKIAGATVLKMDSLDGTWDDITGTLTITATNHNDFQNFLNEVYITNGTDVPYKWTGTGNATTMTVPTGLTKAKYVEEYNNYLFLANVVVSGTTHGSRLYWSDLKDTGTWGATNFIDVAKDDGEEITRIKVLGDRLIVYKTRSIYNVFFTGDAQIPFILPGGGKTNSTVGCIAPFSVQAVDNGHVFLSSDGFYFFDGNNSFKISDKITDTILGMNDTKFTNAVSTNYIAKNRYMVSLTSSGQSTNDRVLVWDYFNNAWSVYVGIASSAMTTVFVNGTEERPYFSDYSGFTYRMDTGTDDYPLNVQTAINGYYYTNWKHFNDIVDQKGIPHAYIYFQVSNSVLTFSYSYDFEQSDQYTQTFSLSVGTDVYGTAKYGTGTYSGTGGQVKRRDLASRGRVVRFKFSNNVIGETFRIDGLGTFVHAETNV